MTCMIVFDMDGTLGDFYAVKGWLDYILNEDPFPYLNAIPRVDMEELCKVLNILRGQGWKVAVTSWLAKDASAHYDEIVRKAKREWLNKFNFPADEIHLVKYGATKANSTRGKAEYQILFDDNEKIRAGWTLGAAYDVNDILNVLNSLLT